MTTTRLITVREARAILGIARSTLEKRVIEGSLPDAARLGNRRVWPVTEIQIIADCIAAGATDSELREISARIMAARKFKADAALAAIEGAATKSLIA